MEGTTPRPNARPPHRVPGGGRILKVAIIGTGVWLIVKKFAQ